MNILHDRLDPEQERIALGSETSALVLAGPGSGKTRLLTNVAAYRVRQTPNSRRRILCVTFSVEATNQLRQRLRDPRLGVVGTHRLHVANFHQLGAQILHAYADQAGWSRTSQTLDNPDEFMKELLGDLHLGYLNAQGVASAISRLRNRRPTGQTQVPAETLQRVAEAYEARKLERAVWDFDDLIIRSVELLDKAPAVLEVAQTMFGYIVVDELQDTSGYQLELLARISNEGQTPLFGVADDDQMIYAWRDARPENITEFEKRFRARDCLLVGNYRCPPKIVEAANTIIAPTRPDGAGRAAESRVEKREGQTIVRLTASGVDHGAVVAQVVQEEIVDGVEPKEIAILSAISFKFGDLKLAFDAARPTVPYVHIGDRTLIATPLARVLLATLNCRERLDSPASRTRLLVTLSRALPAEESAAIEALARQLIEASSPDAALSVARSALLIPTTDQAAVHIRRIVLAATRDAATYSQSHAATSIVLEWNRLDAKLRREEQSVKLMTTFSAKGLEFDTVVIPFFEDGLAPYVRKGTAPDAEWWAEERRKLYVAVTRARRRVIFVCSGQPSTFLGELNGQLLTWSPTLLREVDLPGGARSST